MSGSHMARWSLYILRCRDGSLYTGIATDVLRRISEHEGNDARGAKYLRGRGPFRLVYSKKVASRAVALRLERSIKKLRKVDKEALIHEEGAKAGSRRHRLIASIPRET